MEVLLTDEPLDTELPPEGTVVRPPVDKSNCYAGTAHWRGACFPT